MPQLQSEVPCLHLERARDREGGSKTAWCADCWQGECLGMGQWWRELKEVNKPPCQSKFTKTALKRGGFLHLVKEESPKTPFFRSKVLTRKMIFEEYINFKIFCYLRHCGVIPVQSFGSPICPQASRLGLKNYIPRVSLKRIAPPPPTSGQAHICSSSAIIIFFSAPYACISDKLTTISTFYLSFFLFCSNFPPY